MIDTKELRIGNLVQDKDGNEIEVLSLGLNNGDGEADLRDEDIYPIPLSKEWAERMGFANPHLETHYSLRLDDITYMYYHTDTGSFGIAITNEDRNSDTEELYHEMEHIKSVHHIQNLWMFLVGTELPIKPKQEQ